MTKFGSVMMSCVSSEFNINFWGGKQNFMELQFLNPSNKNPHKECKPNYSISAKKKERVVCIGSPLLLFPLLCFALPCIHFSPLSSPPLPFVS